MGFFDKWFRSGALAGDPGELRAALFAAVSDSTRLETLCRQHEPAILEHFDSWQKLPPELRRDPRLIPPYMAGLLGVAKHFASHGNPTLLAKLMPPDNPITRMQDALGDVRALIEGQRYDAAIARLCALLDDLDELSGSAVDRYLPIALGNLSECRFHSGQAADAVAPAERALALCERQADVEGVIAYRRNLYEIHRYLAQPEAAARRVSELAEALGENSGAHDVAWYRRQSQILRAGEPLNRVILIVSGQRYEQDDAPALDGKVELVFQRNRMTLAPAARAIDQGKRHGDGGDYAAALDAFERAAQLDVFSPEPSYLRALSLLHLQRYAEAVASYERCEELAPGWYHCRSDLWFAQQLATGALEHEALLSHLRLSDGDDSAEDKVELSARLIRGAPAVAPFHLHHGEALLALERRDEAAAAWRRGLALEADSGTRTRLLLQLAVHGHAADRNALLEEAAELDGDRVSAAMARLLLRQPSPDPS